MCIICISNSVLAAPSSSPNTISYEKHQQLKLVLHKKKLDSERHLFLPQPLPVKVTVANLNWVTTISICNISGRVVPLKNLEFNFNYAVPMPTNIWGNPWVGWRLESQNGSAVILKGGVEWSPDFEPDPNCAHPLTIQFNAAPTTPLPTGPFSFKAENGSPPAPLTGSLNVTVGSAPLSGLANPRVTVTGSNFNQQREVAWNTSWVLTQLNQGNYTVTGSTIAEGEDNYVSEPITVTILGGLMQQATLTYKKGAPATGKVIIKLINPPTRQVPLSFAGKIRTINQTVCNNSILTLPADTYNVSSIIPGFTTTIIPNPLIVPINTELTVSYTSTNPSTGFRTINFVNQCPFPVWFGFVSGATPNRTGSACASDADCYPGSTCVDRGSGGRQCFWKTPVPANNNFYLSANGGTNNVQIPIYKEGLNYIWSGAVSGRTNCTSSGCETADCGAGTGACPAGRGFIQPATQAEFTLGLITPDYYDVEFINGMNLPLSMSPLLSEPKMGGPYDCGSPGATNPVSPLGVCTWEMFPPAVEYNWVRAGGNVCSSSDQCAAPNKCGLSFNPGQNPPFKKTCGKLLGYWTANQICGIQPSYGSPFDCQKPLPAPQQNLRLLNLYGCTQVGSCYQPNAASTCCGCANWDKLGIDVPASPYTQQCVNSNPTWISKVQPTLAWLKKACPSLYSYPYDDMSSTFVCRVMKDDGGKQVNSVDYTITFCPGGKTGGIS